MSGQTVRILYHYNHLVLGMNTNGLTHEDSLRQPTPGGNCMNWVLGHIVANRNTILKALGQEPIWTEKTAEPYQRGSAPLTGESDAIPLEQILEDLNASQERILGALDRMDPERLSGPPPPDLTKDKDETLGSLLTVLGFHEAYHAGQTGLLRRLLGKPGAIP
jgi:uncharacterized damage-inducible protein DinB